MAKKSRYNTRYKLTYHKPSKRWKKVYRGVTHYLKSGVGSKTDENYQLAFAEWEALKAELDWEAGRLPDSSPTATARRSLEPIPVVESEPPATVDSGQSVQPIAQPETTEADRPQRSKFEQEYFGVLPNDPPHIQFRGPEGIDNFIRYEHMAELSESTELETTVAGDKTIKGLVAAYLSIRRTKAKAGELSSKQFAEDKTNLDVLLAFCSMQEVKQIEQLNESVLIDFQTAMRKATIKTDGRKPISPFTANKRLKVLKRWLLWCFESGYLETLPRNHRKLANIKLPKPNPQFLPVEDIRVLFNDAKPRVQLYIALALNCGYTQIDIATLTHEMVASGIVRRERHKTQADQTHKLWPVTQALIEREKTGTETELLFLNQNGNPLYVDGINSKGNHTQTDTISLAFNRHTRLLREADAKRVENGKPKRLSFDGSIMFKYFRKTSANLIEQNYQETPHLTSMFLAHSENAMKRHYASKHYELLFDAIDWLDSQYRLPMPKAADGI